MVRAMEECDETSQRISKALVFGMDETQPGATLTNRERIMAEFTDLVAVMEMIGLHPRSLDEGAIHAKKEKVEKYLAYSAECGTVDDAPSIRTCAYDKCNRRIDVSRKTKKQTPGRTERARYCSNVCRAQASRARRKYFSTLTL
jgi:hypothetical protein